MTDSITEKSIATVEDAHRAIRAAITELKRTNVDVPIWLYRAAHALSREIAERRPS
jgi:hypothetical protein